MNKFLSSLLIVFSFSASANSVVSLSCLNHFIQTDGAKVIESPSAEEKKLIESAKEDVAKKNSFLVKHYNVVRTKIKALEASPYSSLKQYGIEVEYCDDEDYSQSNCYSYIYSANVRNLTLMAIYDIPHSGAEESVTFICE